MQTGCQGPFVNGTGGFCGCDCKCCPPPCCPIVAVYFDCGSPKSDDNPQGCTFSMSLAPDSTPLWADLNLQLPIPELPEFSKEPIRSKDGRFKLGNGSVPCSVPCANICVELKCGGGSTPCCCLQIKDGKILSVGNGYVTAPTTVPIDNDCTQATVLLNGNPPPIFVNDGAEIIVTLIPDHTDCCQCQQVNVLCAPCPKSMGFASKQIPLWKRKTDSRTGKIKINPKTGLPLIMINKAELLRRIIERTRKSRRSK